MMLVRSRPQSHIALKRLRLMIQGTVQGIGFRPFVYGLATELGLKGWVNNTQVGVTIEVEGDRAVLNQFLQRLQREKPSQADIQQIDQQWLPPQGFSQFEIQASERTSASISALILPDLATCPACLQELFDPTNRRYRYPFINCTHCGPRFSILERLPYDRPHTTMRRFTLCGDCQCEYEQPRDRRFHAQPNACPRCGPHLELWDRSGQVLAIGTAEVLAAATQAIQQGKILVLKGLSGFHLIVDARNPEAVQTLRQRKHRPDKPLALMYPTLAQVRSHCHVSPIEAELLQSAAAPIVLLNKAVGAEKELAPAIAPGLTELGVMLPYTPLHHLLLADLGFPVVATSGNRSGEPICIEEQTALGQLAGIADWFLIHDRPILRGLDDSVVRVVHDQPLILRRSRGYAPLPLRISPSSKPDSDCLLAVGGHLKNAIAWCHHDQIWLSQYLGDLDQAQTLERVQSAIAQWQQLYHLQPTAIACDAHPHYRSTSLAQAIAQSLQVPLICVQHHYAHVLACMAEHQLFPPILGIAWDGTGYGLDGTVWGGEGLAIAADGFERFARLRPFGLPGGDAAAREPRRSALGLLYGMLGEAAFDLNHLAPLQVFSRQELQVLRAMMQRGLNTPTTSSMGRLFDAIASLLNLCQRSSFEGQAAMQLESAIAPGPVHPAYDLPLNQSVQPAQLDWGPMVAGILDDLAQQVSPSIIAARFHQALAQGIVAIAQAYYGDRADPSSNQSVVLSGGCFQNRYLLEQVCDRLRTAGFTPYWPQQFPGNDGGLALGQVMAARCQLSQR